MRDPRLDMAIKYHLAGLDGEAWGLAAEIVAEKDAPAAALEFAATLRQASGDYQAALAFADRAIAAEPARASAHFVRGAALEAQGQLVNAEIAYRDAVG
jgi:Flp pilus assembly protein TadD